MIFISYRRSDSSASAGRLYDRLVADFDQDEVFLDVGAIEPGEDFVRLIEESIDASDVVLAVMGPRWLAVTDESGKRRLTDPLDRVRLEIEAAFARKITVVPVLVDGATMPLSSELPSSLSPLARLQAAELSHLRYEADLDRLLRAIHRIFQARPQQLAQDYCTRGDEFLRDREYKEAIAEYTKAVNAAPHYAEAFAKRAKAYADSRLPWGFKHEMAIRDLDQAIALAPDRPELYLLRGISIYQMPDFGKALDDFNKSISLQPTAEAHSWRASCYKALKQPKKATDECTKAIELKPDTYQYERRARMYEELGDFKRSIRDFTTAIDLGSSDGYSSSLYSARAESYAKNEQFDFAIRDYTRTIEMSHGPWDYTGRGNAYAAIGDLEKANMDYKLAIIAYTEVIASAEAEGRSGILTSFDYFGRGETYELLQEHEKALRDLERSRELSEYEDDDRVNDAIERIRARMRGSKPGCD